jgi:hypothetical protein
VIFEHGVVKPHLDAVTFVRRIPDRPGYDRCNEQECHQEKHRPQQTNGIIHPLR